MKNPAHGALTCCTAATLNDCVSQLSVPFSTFFMLFLSADDGGQHFSGFRGHNLLN